MGGVLGALIGSSASAAFIATGGTIVEFGGYRYHIFTSSGTFTAPNTSKPYSYMFLDGGSAGLTGPTTGAFGANASYGGNGGAGGQARFATSGGATSIAVTVAGAGGSSSVSVGVSVVATQAGGAGGTGSRTYAWNYQEAAATQGGSVPLVNTRGVPWNVLQRSAATNSGGGGGPSFSRDDAGSPDRSQPGGAGGAGGYNTTINGATGGSSAGANTGGGGGGGYTEGYTFYGSIYNIQRFGGGNGGSGIVIIAYQI